MPTFVHIDIASDDPSRAKSFYKQLFDWEFDNPPGMPDYFLYGTKDLEGKQSIGGGLGKRDVPTQAITVFIGVDDIDKYRKEVEKLGGKIIYNKMPVPGWGYSAYCADTEGNPFGLWQDDENALP